MNDLDKSVCIVLSLNFSH